jgi:diguanylate cyclase (GGDEF)-like protein
MLGRLFTDFVSLEEKERIWQLFQGVLQGDCCVSQESKQIGKDGRDIYLSFNANPWQDSQGNIIGATGTASDISDRKLYERALQRRVERDSLFNSVSRVFLDRDLDTAIDFTLAAIGKFTDSDRVCIFKYFDGDRFKVINNSLGHSNGDRLLIAFARRLESCLNCFGTLSRLGGDEFAILLEKIEDSEEATHIVKQIDREMMLPFQLSKLKTMGCEFAQGYFFSRPLDRENTEALIKKNPQF